MSRHLLTLVIATTIATPVSADQIVQKWAGSGLLITRPITFEAPWELQWQSDSLFQVVLEDKDGAVVEILANQITQGPGSSYEPRTGTFILKFSAMGPWKAQAVVVGR